jgi:hypothetical protein
MEQQLLSYQQRSEAVQRGQNIAGHLFRPPTVRAQTCWKESVIFDEGGATCK